MNILFYPEPQKSVSKRVIMVKSEERKKEKKKYYLIVITAVRTESRRSNRRIMRAKLSTSAISDFIVPRAFIPLGSASLRLHDAHNRLHKISFLSFKSDPQSTTPRCEMTSILLSHSERVS
jgi:hypothetical protein